MQVFYATAGMGRELAGLGYFGGNAAMFRCSERSPAAAAAAEGSDQQTRVVGQGGSGLLEELPALGLRKKQIANHPRNAVKATRCPPPCTMALAGVVIIFVNFLSTVC